MVSTVYSFLMERVFILIQLIKSLLSENIVRVRDNTEEEITASELSQDVKSFVKARTGKEFE